MSQNQIQLKGLGLYTYFIDLQIEVRFAEIEHIHYSKKRNMISTIFGMWTLSGPAVRGHA